MSSRRSAAGYAALSGLLFAATGVAVKVAARELPPGVIVLGRNVICVMVLLPFLLRRLPTTPTKGLRGYLVGIAGVAAMWAFFYAIAHLDFSTAVMLSQAGPLLVPLVASVWLAEAVPKGLWWKLGLGFVGIVLIVEPTKLSIAPAVFVGLASALLAAISQVGARRLARTEPPQRIVFYFALLGAVASSPALVAWQPVHRGTLVAVGMAGVFATLAQLSITRAYTRATAAEVGPFAYCGPVFAALLDWVIWGTLPHRFFLAGSALIVFAAVATLRGSVPRGAPALLVPTPATEPERG